MEKCSKDLDVEVLKLVLRLSLTKARKEFGSDLKHFEASGLCVMCFYIQANFLLLFHEKKPSHSETII